MQSVVVVSFFRRFNNSCTRFTQKNILRVYPKGTRFNSSNYKPQIGWLHGAQMIAFNMQVCLFFFFLLFATI